MSETEKRNYRRRAIWFPVTLIIEGREVWSICRDVSAGGVLLSATLPLPVGVGVDARFKIRRDALERVVKGAVVRQEQPEDELALAFPFRFAVEFEAPIEDLFDGDPPTATVSAKA